jgi:hypothetical protein
MRLRVIGCTNALFLGCSASISCLAQSQRCIPISTEVRAAAVGKTLTPALQQQLLSASGAAMIRILKPNEAATMEARENRLNIQVDENTKILGVWCDPTSKPPM